MGWRPQRTRYKSSHQASWWESWRAPQSLHQRCPGQGGGGTRRAAVRRRVGPISVSSGGGAASSTTTCTHNGLAEERVGPLARAPQDQGGNISRRGTSSLAGANLLGPDATVLLVQPKSCHPHDVCEAEHLPIARHCKTRGSELPPSPREEV